MKLRFAAASLAAVFAFAGVPAQAHAGGLHHICPLHWIKHLHHHHHAHKPVVKKKIVYKKKAAPAKIAKKPMK